MNKTQKLTTCSCPVIQQLIRKHNYSWLRKLLTNENKLRLKYKNLSTCSACKRKFVVEIIYEKCRNQDIHNQRKVPKGACQQCLEKGLKLTKIWNDKYYCQDCLDWGKENDSGGINTCSRFLASYCHNCGKCESCLTRKGLTNYSTRDLLLEIINREDYEALLSWEDDSYKQRTQELIWELGEVKGMTSKDIQELVSKDIFEKKLSQRKFSRGT